jgi:plastocyanin
MLVRLIFTHLLCGLAGVASSPVAATTFMVHTGPGTTFNPQVINLQAGDSVNFVNGTTGGFHDVHAEGAGRCAGGAARTLRVT